MKILVVVDMQKDFLDLGGRLNLGKSTAEFQKRVAQKIKDHEGPVVATLDTHEEKDAEFTHLPPHCIEGTSGWELVTLVQQELSHKSPHYKVSKKSFSENTITTKILNKVGNMGMFNINLEELEFEFVGVCTHICVHDIIATLVHEYKAKLNMIPKITVSKSLVEDFSDEMAENALKRMKNLYCVTIVE